MKEQMERHYNEHVYNDASQKKQGPQTATPDRKLKEETNVNAKKSTTIYMETEHEMSNILTSDNKTTTEMQVV